MVLPARTVSSAHAAVVSVVLCCFLAFARLQPDAVAVYEDERRWK